MKNDFNQVKTTLISIFTMSNEFEKSAKMLINLAFEEDLHDGIDITSEALLDRSETGEARIIAREDGIVCGLKLVPFIVQKFASGLEYRSLCSDGEFVSKDTPILKLSGQAIDLLKIERTILNFLGRLSGIATLTHRFVDLANDSNAKVFDTRKTTPGWRRLEKYAVKCGGGENHRMGLFDAVLIKDNHLAMLDSSEQGWLPRVELALKKIRQSSPDVTVQIEVDNLEQLKALLPLHPDIILLDNMTNAQLSEAVRLRGDHRIEMEASGGVRLSTVAEIAATGVERISVGALTHSAVNFDFGMDWMEKM